MKYLSFLGIVCLSLYSNLSQAQIIMEVEGNGLFSSPSSTNLDIRSTDDNTNSLTRLGDNDENKVSLGFNGNEDVFKISTAETLGSDDLTLALNGKFGINALPTNHRLFIKHNSTSGVSGSSHLTLEASSTAEFSRLLFNNTGDNNEWQINAKATEGSALMNYSFFDGATTTDLLSLEGEMFFVGIHKTAPAAYLHIKQQSAGVDALAIVNDDATGGETWSMRVGSEDILLYFELQNGGGLRGGFDSDTGDYNNFPPPSNMQGKLSGSVLEQIMKLTPVAIDDRNRTKITLDPEQVKQINPEWVVEFEKQGKLGLNYDLFTFLAIQSIQEQQQIIQKQKEKIAALKTTRVGNIARLEALEKLLQI